jgi:hypothetical protein
MAERMEVFCNFTDLALSINPRLKDRMNVKSTTGRVQVISLPQNAVQANSNKDTD